MAEWREKVIVQKHVVQRGELVLCEGLETRAFVVHPDGDPYRLKDIPVPDFIKEKCS